MNEERIEVELSQEDVQSIINCYEKDIKYIKKLENNWNELKKWLEDYRKNKDILVPVSIVELKMQELENNND